MHEYHESWKCRFYMKRVVCVSVYTIVLLLYVSLIGCYNIRK